MHRLPLSTALLAVAGLSLGLSIKFTQRLAVSVVNSRVAAPDAEKLRASVAQARTRCTEHFPEVVLLSEVVSGSSSSEPTYATRVVATLLLAENVSQSAVYQGTIASADSRLRENWPSVAVGDVAVEIVCTPKG